MSSQGTESMSTQVQTVAVETGSEWRMLSYIAIVYFSIKNIFKTAQTLIYAVPALAITANVTDMLASPLAYLVFFGAVTVLSVSGLVSFLMYRFRIHNEHVEIRSGVFQRAHINLPFWRIQNVKIEHPFYYRPFGYSVVVLDTAGSAKEEANIVAVTTEYAEALKSQILSHQKSETSNNTISEAVEVEKNDTSRVNISDETVINRRSIGDIVIHGFTNNRVWILLGAAAPFYDTLVERVGGWLTSKGLQLDQLVGEQTIAWWQFGLYAFAIVMMLMALLALLSVGGALFTFYGYTLSKTADRYIRRSGLLNKQEVSMRATRIQVVSAKQDWLDKILKRVNLYFEQNASLDHGAPELMSSNRLIVPSVTVEETATLAQEVLPDCNLYRDDYRSINRRYIWHCFLVGLLAPFAIAMTIGIVGQHWDVIAGTLAVTAAIAGIIVLRWWRWGIAEDEDYIYVRSGRVGIDYKCFQRFKVQQVVIRQSWFMKRRGLASVKFIMASGAITVPFLPEDYVWSLINKTAYSVESTRRSWM